MLWYFGKHIKYVFCVCVCVDLYINVDICIFISNLYKNNPHHYIEHYFASSRLFLHQHQCMFKTRYTINFELSLARNVLIK